MSRLNDQAPVSGEVFDVHDVIAELNVSRQTLHIWLLAGKFPQPRRFRRWLWWPADEVRAWIDARPRCEAAYAPKPLGPRRRGRGARSAKLAEVGA